MTNSIAVLGGGSFGTALANVIASNGHDVHQWMRDPELANRINQQHENARYLPGIPLAQSLSATTDIAAAVSHSSVVFIAIPSHSFRDICKQCKPFLPAAEETLVVTTTKGIEKPQFKLMSDIIREELPGYPLAVLSGPNLAKEITQKNITGSVVASTDPQICRRLQDVLSCDFFRVYANPDVYGVELGGALKNIYAIASGMLSALRLGENTKSMLITRGLAEMSRFAVAMGANPLTFLGLAGVGDLVVTCNSALSRNYQVGQALGEGKTLAQASKSLGQTAEGVNTLAVVAEKAKQEGIYMPIVLGLNAIIFEGASMGEVIKQLMAGEQAQDVEFIYS